MRIVEENEKEIFIEIDRKDLPLNFSSQGKQLYVKWIDPEESIKGLGKPMPRIFDDKKDMIGLFPEENVLST